MRYPKWISKGGKLGFAAPAFGCNIEPYYSAFQNACLNFKNKGHELMIGRNVFLGEGVGISNTPVKCAEEINEFFSSDCDAIFSCGGGELMCEILDFVDFEKIAKESPKWFMGYSDNTNLTFLLNILCDTATIYAPCAPAFGMEPWHLALQNAWDLLTGVSLSVHSFDLWEKESQKTSEHPLKPYYVTEPVLLKSIPANQDIQMKGRLLGGCIDVLGNLVGTPYDKVQKYLEKYKEDGFIWYLEACDLNPFGVRRALWQMKHAGWFQYASGFLIGRPMHFGENLMGLDQYQAVAGALQEMNIPIIMDIDLGHLPPAMPILSGAVGDVRMKQNKLSIFYETK